MATKYASLADPNLATAMGGAPASGDTVYVNKWATDYNAADLSAADLTLFVITAGFSGSFQAANSGQLKLVVNQTGAGVFINQSSSPRIDLVSTSSTGVIDEIRNQPAIGGVLTISTLKCTDFFQVDRGSVRIASDVDLTNAYIDGGRVEFADGASFTTTLIVACSGDVVLNRDATTVNIEGTATVTINSTNCTPTTINMRGGTLVVAECGGIGTIAGFSGLVDFSRCTRPTTVTARACGPGVTFRLPKSGLVTFSGTSGDTGGGPVLEYV